MKKFTSLLLTAMMASFSINAQDAQIYLTGGGCPQVGWTTANNDNNKLVWNNETQTYDFTGDFVSSDRFRFITTDKWYPTYTTTESSHTVINEDGTFPIQYDETGRSGEPSFKVGKSGNYTLSVSLENMTMAIKENVPEYPNIYMLGAGTPAGWTTANASDWQMSRNELTYSWTGPLTHKDGGRFYFVTKNDYWPRFTSTDVTVNPHSIKPGETYDLKYYETSAAEQTEGWKDPAFSVEEPGVYTITLTLSDDKQSATFSIVQETICIMGPAVEGNGDWDFGQINNNPFEMVESGKYQWTGELKIVEGDGKKDPGLFRIHQKGKWSPCFGSVNDDNNVSAEAANYNLKWYYVNKSFKIAADGTYTIQLDLNADPVMSVSQGSEIVEVPLTELYMVGSALCGKEGAWSFNDDFVKAMTPTENPGEFTWTGDLHKTGGQFKFLYKNNSWDGMVASPDDIHFVSGETYAIVPSKGNPDKKFFVDEDGKYTVLAKTYGENKSVTITKMGTDGIEAAAAEANGVKVMGNVVMAEGVAVVYDAMGRTVGTIDNGSLTLPAAGIYVVVANGTATKIAVK